MRRNVTKQQSPPPEITPREELAADVRAGLGGRGQKQLPPKYFYDALGSALFDAITLLPEYGLTAADARLLRDHSRELADLACRPSVVVELGSGSGLKTRWILEEMVSRFPVTYCPIDISAAALVRCERELRDIRGVEIVAIEAAFAAGLQKAAELREPNTPMLVLFLGSSIGNFSSAEAESFCRDIHRALQPGDLFLLSADLEKDNARMLAAYDDPIGLTAAFNRNLLARINRELQSDFDIRRFRHLVRYDTKTQRIEMHLESTIDQIVNIGPGFRVAFRRGETIWTESSYKFRPDNLRKLAQRTGFRCEVQWIDEEWPFAQSVFRVLS